MCFRKSTLREFNNGELSQSHVQLVESHLPQCQLCRDQLAALKAEKPPNDDEVSRLAGEKAITFNADRDLAPDRLPRGTSLGRYLLVDILGAGGMGVVYSAYDPELDRKVALKILRTDLSSEDHRIRLMREAQAIARLSHPNVVAIHDVGTSSTGLFIAMELVRGKTLRQWIAGKECSWKELRDIFLQAGRGLAAAHTAGLTHRDFKPDNVLVGEDGRVRVTDFGLARSNRSVDSTSESIVGLRFDDRDLPLDTPLTVGPVLVGTPAYMSSEQLAGKSADPLSDQFGFCATLYECLYGYLPFQGRSTKELRAQIETGRALPPPKNTQVPAWLHRVLTRGLSPKPEDRYPSMEALLSDLEARPERARRRLALQVVAISFAACCAGGAYAYARNRASSCDHAAQGLAGIWDSDQKARLQRLFLGTAKPFAKDAWIRTERVLDAYSAAWTAARTRTCYEAQSQSQLPDLQALRALCLDQRLTELKAATEILSRADGASLASAEQSIDRLSPIADCEDLPALASRFRTPADFAIRREVENVRAALLKAKVQSDSSKYADALATLKTSTARAKELGYRPLIAEALLLQGEVQAASGDFHSGEQVLREASRVALEEALEQVAASAATKLTFVVGRQEGRYAEADLWAEQAEALLARHPGERMLRAELSANKGVILAEEGKYDDGLALLNAALQIREQVLGAQHPEIARTLTRVGYVEILAGKYVPSVEHSQRALDILTQALGPLHPLVASSLGNLALSLAVEEKFSEALPRFQKAIEILEEAEDKESYALSMPFLNLGYSEMRLGKYDQAQAHLQRSLELYEKSFGRDSPRTAAPLENLGFLSTRQGNYGQAIEYHQRALAIRQQKQGADHPDVASSLAGLGKVFLAEGKLQKAQGMLSRALELRAKRFGPENILTGESHYDYGWLLLAIGSNREAVVHFQRALDISSKALAADSLQVGERLAGLGQAHLESGDAQTALPILERSLHIANSQDLDTRDLATRQFALARAVWLTRSDLPRARQLAVEALGNFSKVGTRGAKDHKLVQRWVRGLRRS